MPLQVALIDSAADFDKIGPMDYDGWRTPGNPQLKHFRPVLPTREEEIAYVKARDVEQWKEADPNRFMLKVTDDETDEIVGWAIWEIKHPGKKEGDEKVVVDWHPAGSEEKAFAEIFINGLWKFLAERVPRKHLDLDLVVVHPLHRHRGVGRLLMSWGKTKADELGIEMVISSLLSARTAYAKSGFGCIEPIPPDPELFVEREGRGKKWKELLDDDLSGWLMWRPVGRDWREGDIAPWMVNSV